MPHVTITSTRYAAIVHICIFFIIYIDVYVIFLFLIRFIYVCIFYYENDTDTNVL